MPQRVLLVDDEAPLLQLMASFLTRNGYEVEAFRNPLDALERFRPDGARYRLVIADVTMPGLSGDELVRQLAELSDEVHVLLLSGLPFSTERLPSQLRERVAFLQKPFLPDMLLAQVAQLERRLVGRQTSDNAC